MRLDGDQNRSFIGQAISGNSVRVSPTGGEPRSPLQQRSNSQSMDAYNEQLEKFSRKLSEFNSKLNVYKVYSDGVEEFLNCDRNACKNSSDLKISSFDQSSPVFSRNRLVRSDARISLSLLPADNDKPSSLPRNRPISVNSNQNRTSHEKIDHHRITERKKSDPNSSTTPAKLSWRQRSSSERAKYSERSDDGCFSDPENKSYESCSLTVGSLIKSPKWWSIKQKFESSSGNSIESESRQRYSSPQTARRGHLRATDTIHASSSMSSLYLTRNSSRIHSLSSVLNNRSDERIDEGRSQRATPTENKQLSKRESPSSSKPQFNEASKQLKTISLSTASPKGTSGNECSTIVSSVPVKPPTMTGESGREMCENLNADSLSSRSISRVAEIAMKFDDSSRTLPKTASPRSRSNSHSNSTLPKSASNQRFVKTGSTQIVKSNSTESESVRKSVTQSTKRSTDEHLLSVRQTVQLLERRRSLTTSSMKNIASSEKSSVKSVDQTQTSNQHLCSNYVSNDRTSSELAEMSSNTPQPMPRKGGAKVSTLNLCTKSTEKSEKSELETSLSSSSATPLSEIPQSASAEQPQSPPVLSQSSSNPVWFRTRNFLLSTLNQGRQLIRDTKRDETTQQSQKVNKTGDNSNGVDSCEQQLIAEDPIYELVQHYNTVNATPLTTNNNNSNNSENRLTMNSDSDNVSLNSEGSSLYSDCSSHSSSLYESTMTRGRNIRPRSATIDPPPLPPRRLSSGTCKQRIINFNERSERIVRSESSEESHIYQSIYNGMSDVSNNNEDEDLYNKLIEKLEAAFNGKTDEKCKTVDSSISRTPSSLSSTSISRHGSSASDCRLSNRASSSGSENNSPRVSYQPMTPPPRNSLQMRMTKSLHKREFDSFTDSQSGNFPTIKENDVLTNNSLSESISEISSPLLREFIGDSLRRVAGNQAEDSAAAKTSTSLTFRQSTRSSLVSKQSSDYIEAFPVNDQHCPHLVQSAGSITHPYNTVHAVEVEGYIEFEETKEFLTNNQPLYQFYDQGVKLRRALWAHSDVDKQPEIEDENIYGAVECIYDELPQKSAGKVTDIELDPKTHNVSAMDLVGRGYRHLWCEVPQVRDSGILETMNKHQRIHQEAMFEVITSEASYLKSLDILVNHFMNSVEFNNSEILAPQKKAELFSHVTSVLDISRKLMTDLDRRWQENVIITDVCDILYEYAISKFADYIRYIMFQVQQERTLKGLLKQARFADALRKLESNPVCQGLTLISFLLLPMQRITRYPLLVEAILNHRSSDNKEGIKICEKTLATLNKVVCECNSAARKYEEWHELNELGNKLKFDKVRNFPLVSSSRYLLKKCQAVRLEPETSLLYGNKNKNQAWKRSLNHLFLFNDLIIIAKKKSDEYYSVHDYCDRDMVQVKDVSSSSDDSLSGLSSNSNNVQQRQRDLPKNLLRFSFLENQAGRSKDYFFSFPSETERLRFVEAFEPPKSDNPNEKIYEEWDCPQVICEKPYLAQQPDELTLEESDVINVLRKQNDWYEGERIRDGAKGWFPATNTVEILNRHVRTRNMKLRHRLMVLNESNFNEIKPLE